MKKVTAFTPVFNEGVLFHSARSAREAEFDHLMIDIGQHIASDPNIPPMLKKLAGFLRGGIYPSGADAFLRAADYLRQHRMVLTGAELDPDENRE